MRTFTIACALTLGVAAISSASSDPYIQSIIQKAEADAIDFKTLHAIDVDAILQSIASVATHPRSWESGNAANGTDIVDVHAHCVPDWYRSIVPLTGGNPTPQWNISGHLSFMSAQGISRAVLAFSSPGATVYPGDEGATIALARLINEQSAAFARAYPDQFTFYAVVPLPYTQAAIAEAHYALDTLGAAGIALYSNFEGHYLGHSSFTPFFAAMNARGSEQIIYVHPTTPYIRVNGSLIEANPTIYPTGNIEFYFETARMLSDLAVTQTILNFTNINYIIPHVGGAWPSVADRLLKSFPAIYDRTLEALQTRFFYDSAGPTYFHQVGGLLAYEVPTSQLMYGTDYPYAPIFTYGPSLTALKLSPYLTDADRLDVLHSNAEDLFKSLLPRSS